MSHVSLFALGLAAAALVALFLVIAVRQRLLAQSTRVLEANRRFEATFEQAAVGIAHLDETGRWIRINRRFCEITGYDHDELMDKTVDEITHPEDVGHDHAVRNAMMSGDLDYSAVEKRYVRKDGRIIWVAATRSTVRDASGRPEFFVAVIEEITARNDAESQLSTGGAQYRAIFDSAVEAMAVIDAKGTIQSVNPSVERIFGYPPDELLGKNIKMLMPEAIAQHHDGYLQRYRDTGVKAIIGIGREVIGQRKDGTVFPLDLSVAEWERAGETFFTGVMRDVSARRDAEAALIAGEARARAIFDSAVEAMAVIDPKGTIQSLNPSVERIFGYAPDELLGNNIKMLMPETIAQHHDRYLQRYRDTGIKSIIGIGGREVIGQRKDGTVFPLDLSVAEWERDGDTFFTGVMRDVSARSDAVRALRTSEDELRRLQNEFAHFSRVNDLGEMAAAIAHEINQPLTAIVNYLNTGLYFARGGHSEEAFAETGQVMKNAAEQALRAGEIVRRLRDFIGQGNGERTIERAEQLVDSAMALALIDARSSGITVDRRAGAGEAEVEVDAVQIQQVMANLLRNAVEAMAGTSPGAAARLTISTATAPKGMIEFVVADNGPGVAPELQERLFEPFATNKANGMGMGLSVCRRLIEAHGGTIEAASVPGEGATFTFKLPQSRSISS